MSYECSEEAMKLSLASGPALPSEGTQWLCEMAFKSLQTGFYASTDRAV